MNPVLSICLPTFNRADLLDYTLERLRELEYFGRPFEIVVSDNLSTDHTAQVIAKNQQAMPYLRCCRQSNPCPAYVGWINAVRNARGRYFVALADDDALIPDALWAYVERLEREPDLVAIYADWIAYDDEHEKELNRYFDFEQPASFGPAAPRGLIDFMLRYTIFPEVAVYRRADFLHCDSLIGRGSYPFHMWAYRLSRRGQLAFELTPFYRENRVLKKRFQRTHWSNMAQRKELIGDELRNELETVALWALQDSGDERVPAEHVLSLKEAIDWFLNSRLRLEIGRAKEDKDWLLALELRRRMVLWYGPGTHDEQLQDTREIVAPAAFQAVYELCRTLTDVSGLCLQGFQTQQVHDFFRVHYPEIKLLDSAAHDGAGRPLVVYKQIPDEADAAHDEEDAGYTLCFDRLLDQYRINTTPVSLIHL